MFPLFQRYLGLVDEEHQSVQAAFLTSFVEQYGVTTSNIQQIVFCLLKCQDSIRSKQQELFETPEILKQLLVAISDLHTYEKSHIIDMIWGARRIYIKE